MWLSVAREGNAHKDKEFEVPCHGTHCGVGIGKLGTAIARLWLLEGHHVKGWTIEQEVYESITMDGVNRKYLPQQSVEGLEATMHLDEALDGVEIVVLAIPSSVILNVVDDIIPFLRPGHVLLDLAKGLLQESG